MFSVAIGNFWIEEECVKASWADIRTKPVGVPWPPGIVAKIESYVDILRSVAKHATEGRALSCPNLAAYARCVYVYVPGRVLRTTV